MVTTSYPVFKSELVAHAKQDVIVPKKYPDLQVNAVITVEVAVQAPALDKH